LLVLPPVIGSADARFLLTEEVSPVQEEEEEETEEEEEVCAGHSERMWSPPRNAITTNRLSTVQETSHFEMLIKTQK